MYNNILVPLDGTALAETALPYARAIVSRTGARLTLIRAAKQSTFVADRASDQQRSLVQAEDYLGQLRAALSQDGITVETGVPFGGHPSEWIVEESDLRQADLIVMASHDRVGVDRWLHGSVAESVVHAAKAPVMLVKASDNSAERLESQTPVLVAALDGSQLAESALPTATQMATALGARIVLVSAIPVQAPQMLGYPEVPLPYTEADYAQMVADARAYLDTIVGRIQASGIAAEAAVRVGDPALEIASVGQQYAAWAVVMATHGRTGVVRSILGSVAGAVVHCGNVPVILVRPKSLQPSFAMQNVQEIEACAVS